MTEADFAAMLGHEHWIGCRAPADGSTDRIAFDLDAKRVADVPAQRKRYDTLREVMGVERRPMVYATPSVTGLRVVYRIPRVPLETVITSLTTGLVADVLRGAGLEVRSGALEIFPQRSQIDRLPLGRRMPILDPQTLEPIPDAALGDSFDLGLLEGAIRQFERWHEVVYEDLMPRLRERRSRRPAMIIAPERAARSEMPTSTTSRVGIHERDLVDRPHFGLSADSSLLVTQGLTRPSSRYASEFRVGLAIVVEPTRFGLGPRPTDEQVARALAEWLATHHHGFSRDWYWSVRRFGSEPAAVAWWTNRYLARDARTERHLIDRIRALVARHDPWQRHTRLVPPAERDELMALVADRYPPGAQRYRAECWCMAWRRAVRCIVSYHASRGRSLPIHQAGDRMEVELELCADWMRDWAYGLGANTRTGVLRYIEYREMLEQAGRMVLVSPAPIPMARARGAGKGRELAHVAHRYRTELPDLAIRAEDVGVDQERLSAAIANVRGGYGKRLGLDEAHHVLMLTHWGLPLEARYGAATASTIRGLARAIERALQRGGVREHVDAGSTDAHASTPASAPNGRAVSVHRATRTSVVRRRPSRVVVGAL